MGIEEPPRSPARLAVSPITSTCYMLAIRGRRVPVNEDSARNPRWPGGLGRASRKNMVHEGTGLWHAAGFNASRWLMIIIHGYRATSLVLYVLLNVLVRTGEYNHFPTPFGNVCFSAACLRTPKRRQSGCQPGVKQRLRSERYSY